MRGATGGNGRRYYAGDVKILCRGCENLPVRKNWPTRTKNSKRSWKWGRGAMELGGEMMWKAVGCK
jgi:hypothetical protein